MTGTSFEHTVYSRNDGQGYKIKVQLGDNVEFYAHDTWKFAISLDAFEDFATVIAYIDKLIKGEIGA